MPAKEPHEHRPARWSLRGDARSQTAVAAITIRPSRRWRPSRNTSVEIIDKGKVGITPSDVFASAASNRIGAFGLDTSRMRRLPPLSKRCSSPDRSTERMHFLFHQQGSLGVAGAQKVACSRHERPITLRHPNSGVSAWRPDREAATRKVKPPILAR